MNKTIAIVGGAGIGAGLMYLWDPDRGRRRRALVRDQFVHSANIAGDATETLARDARNRGYGVWASIRSWLRPEFEDVTDERLVERVRSHLGMLTRHPSAIEVQADGGRVIVSGPILEDEVQYLLRGIARIPGVRQVADRLEVHAEPGDVPALQGGSWRSWPPASFEFFQQNWSSTARALSGATGGALTLYGIRTGNVMGTALTIAGVGLLATGLGNRSLQDMGRNVRDLARRGRDVRAGRRIRDVMTAGVETVHPDATVDEVAQKMKRLNVGAIPVCDGNRIEGMLTDRDIVVRVIGENRDPRAVRVRDAMTADVQYGFEGDDVETASRIMREHQIRRLPIVDERHNLVGIVSLGDLATDVGDDRLSGETLEQISRP